MMVENKLTELEARLESLTDKIDFAQEDIGLQLKEVMCDLRKARIAIHATKSWMKKKDDEKQEAKR